MDCYTRQYPFLIAPINVPANHSHKGVECQASHEQQLGNGDPELCFSIPTDTPQVQRANYNDTNGDENGGVQVECPVFDNDVNCNELEAYQCPLGDEVL
jgi:hypothetical protein